MPNVLGALVGGARPGQAGPGPGTACTALHATVLPNSTHKHTLCAWLPWCSEHTHAHTGTHTHTHTQTHTQTHTHRHTHRHTHTRTSPADRSVSHLRCCGSTCRRSAWTVSQGAKAPAAAARPHGRTNERVPGGLAVETKPWLLTYAPSHRHDIRHSAMATLIHPESLTLLASCPLLARSLACRSRPQAPPPRHSAAAAAAQRLRVRDRGGWGAWAAVWGCALEWVPHCCHRLLRLKQKARAVGARLKWRTAVAAAARTHVRHNPERNRPVQPRASAFSNRCYCLPLLPAAAAVVATAAAAGGLVHPGLPPATGRVAVRGGGAAGAARPERMQGWAWEGS